jgi:arginyl-tRNA synthetase
MTVARQLTELIATAANEAGHGQSKIPLEACVPTNDHRHGDYQSNFAFRLGKSLGTNPRAIAQTIVEHLPNSTMVKSAAVAGPGFINFKLTDEWLAQHLQAVGTEPDLGIRPAAGKTLVIDYSSPNIAKRMHVGHIRSTIIGNALHRIYAFLGWKVIADNHIGDWGTQFGKLIVAWREWGGECPIDDDPIGKLQWLYQQFGKHAQADPGLLEQARAETAKLQSGEPDNRVLWQEFVDVSIREFDSIYQRLGIQFDVTHGESFYQDALQPLVDRLLERGIAVEDDGAVIIPFEQGDGKGLNKSPLLIRKSDGAALYGTTDLATVEHRVQTWRPDTIAYVTDVRQKLHFRQIFAASKKMGYDQNFAHIWFGMLRIPGGAIASTREGQVINLVDVLNTAAQKAFDIVSKKSAHLDEAERRTIAEAVGVGAIKYADLSQNPQTDITFDWDRMLAMEGNTAPYIMYAHARCCSILHKAGEASHRPGPIRFIHPAERALAVTLARTPEQLEAAAHSWRPNLLCDHLFQITSNFGTFYRECHVLQAENQALVASRLQLVACTANALKIGLDLLGLTALKRM